MAGRVPFLIPGQVGPLRYNSHVCGEAYSGIQAVIEGALKSTELVLRSNWSWAGPNGCRSSTTSVPGDNELGEGTQSHRRKRR